MACIPASCAAPLLVAEPVQRQLSAALLLQLSELATPARRLSLEAKYGRLVALCVKQS